MPVALGDTIPAVREHKESGGSARTCSTCTLIALRYLADIVNNRNIIDAIGTLEDCSVLGQRSTFKLFDGSPLG